METGEVEQREEKDVQMEKAVKDLSENFNKNGIKYYIIGSLARNTYMGKELHSPEIDILIPDETEREKAEPLMKEVRTNNPNISLDASLSDIVSEEDGQYFLGYGNVKYPVDASIFEPSEIQIGETKFITLKPPALLHTYTFVGGPFREKDWRNALIFSRWMKDQGISYEHSSYSNFHQFGKERWKNSPLRKVQSAWRSVINSLPEDTRNKVFESYDSPVVTSVREIFNKLERATCGTVSEK